jgi:hypothetical protein
MELFTETEAALKLGCSIHKMQKDRRVGSPIPFIKIGRSVRYKLVDIEAYIEQQRFTSTSEYNGGVHG